MGSETYISSGDMKFPTELQYWLDCKAEIIRRYPDQYIIIRGQSVVWASDEFF